MPRQLQRPRVAGACPAASITWRTAPTGKLALRPRPGASDRPARRDSAKRRRQLIDRDARYPHRLPYRFPSAPFRRQRNDPRTLTIAYRSRIGAQSLAQFPLLIQIQLDPLPGHDPLLSSRYLERIPNRIDCKDI
jgi:hypothetical protein